MTKKVLFVDDEQSLLNGLERRLGLEFTMETACSGDEALEKMEQDGPYAVIVTDMQMPKMNGVQFIKHARMLAPDTVYLMLTGNQDVETAAQAVNGGEVYRFLNKPCEMQDIKRAVDAGLRHYQLVISEKELLQKTVVGTINVLSDVLEVSQPDLFSRSPTVEETFEHLRKQLDIRNHWEFTLASRLGLVGFALLTERERMIFEQAPITSQESQDVMKQMGSLSSRLIEKIPRLEGVARIIGLQSASDGRLPDDSPENLPQLGATLLRVSSQWSGLRSSGLSTEASLRELERTLPNLSVEISSALMGMHKLDNEATVELAPKELREGMVVAADVLTIEDERLVRAGRHLSEAMIEKLRLFHVSQKPLQPILVYQSTCATLNLAMC